VHYGYDQIFTKEKLRRMTSSSQPTPLLQGLNQAEYEIRSVEDEIRVDQQCVGLLRHLFNDLTVRGGMSPQLAGEACHGADYFLREFIIGDRHENLFAAAAEHVRQFAGHWYIVRTAEPNLAELQGILGGTEEFYRFLLRQGLVAEDTVAAIAGQCRDLDYYRQRIDDFWAIEGGGYDAWRQACPLGPAAE